MIKRANISPTLSYAHVVGEDQRDGLESLQGNGPRFGHNSRTFYGEAE